MKPKVQISPIKGSLPQATAVSGSKVAVDMATANIDFNGNLDISIYLFIFISKKKPDDGDWSNGIGSDRDQA